MRGTRNDNKAWLAAAGLGENKVSAPGSRKPRPWHLKAYRPGPTHTSDV